MRKCWLLMSLLPAAGCQEGMSMVGSMDGGADSSLAGCTSDCAAGTDAVDASVSSDTGNGDDAGLALVGDPCGNGIDDDGDGLVDEGCSAAGEPCTRFADCAEGICAAAVGDIPRCRVQCLEEADCAAGEGCRRPGGDLEPLYLCLPLALKHCALCSSDAECVAIAVSDKGSCTLDPDSGATLCLYPCPVTGCAPGTVCIEALCRPSSGTCGCFGGDSRYCEHANEVGICAGVLACEAGEWGHCSARVPATEECNGIDDDCDGTVDEACVADCSEAAQCDDRDTCTTDGCISDTHTCTHVQDRALDPATCGPDGDLDGVIDTLDNCPQDPSPKQTDQDGDGLGDACDGDRDGDGLGNDKDNCPDTPNADQDDHDQDQAGDACDADDDGDQIPDPDDNCPIAANVDQKDFDGDGHGDVCDPDDDNDDTLDYIDCAPKDAKVYPGADEICDNDKDDDCDGLTDECE